MTTLSDLVDRLTTNSCQKSAIISQRRASEFSRTVQKSSQCSLYCLNYVKEDIAYLGFVQMPLVE